MENVTLNNGTVMTDAAFIQERGQGDATVTEFVATKEGLKLLAKALVNEVLGEEFLLGLEYDLNWIARKDYALFRLERVMDFLPEMEDEVKEKLRVGRTKNEKDLEVYLSAAREGASQQEALERIGWKRSHRE